MPDLHRRGFADGQPDAVSDGGLCRIRARLTAGASTRGDRPRQTTRGLSRAQTRAEFGADRRGETARRRRRAKGPGGAGHGDQPRNRLPVFAHAHARPPRTHGWLTAMASPVSAVPIEALAALRRRLAAVSARHSERRLLMESTAQLYAVSRATLYRLLREDRRPKDAYRSDRGRTRAMPADEIER